jgi:dTMP kinase
LIFKKTLTYSIIQDTLENEALVYCSGLSMTKLVTAGKLIVVEGIDGAGKSTLAARVVSLLQEDNCQVLLTREPGGTQGGATIRACLTDGVGRQVPEAEYLLFAADRALHVAQVVLPALQRGTIVVSDRMIDSSYAYQVCGRGIDASLVNAVNQWTMKGIVPDLTIYLAIDYSAAQQRLQKNVRSGELLHYDQERADFFRRVIRGYDALYANRKDVIKLDAMQKVETNAQVVHQHICALMGS